MEITTIFYETDFMTDNCLPTSGSLTTAWRLSDSCIRAKKFPKIVPENVTKIVQKIVYKITHEIVYKIVYETVLDLFMRLSTKLS